MTVTINPPPATASFSANGSRTSESKTPTISGSWIACRQTQEMPAFPPQALHVPGHEGQKLNLRTTVNSGFPQWGQACMGLAIREEPPEV